MNDEYDVTTETMREDLVELVLADNGDTDTDVNRAKALADRLIARGFRRHFYVFDESEVEDLPLGSVLVDGYGTTLTAMYTWVKGRGSVRLWMGVSSEFDDYEVPLPAYVLRVDDGTGPWMRIDWVPNGSWVEGNDGAVFFVDWPEGSELRRLAHWVDGELHDLQGVGESDTWYLAWENANAHGPFRLRERP